MLGGSILGSNLSVLLDCGFYSAVLSLGGIGVRG